MALEDTNSTATPVPQSAPDNAPPDVNTPAPSVDLSGLVQPGSSLVPGQAAPIAHERLYKIIQAIGMGLSSAATSIATHGAEGGAKEVLAMQGEQQRQKLQAQEAAQSMKNVQIQQQVTALDTNYKLAQMISFGASLPDETAKRHLELAGEQQRQNIVGAEFVKANWGL